MKAKAKAKRILVTGASGFLGSHVVRRLFEEGHFVTGTFGKTRMTGKVQAKCVPLELTRKQEIESVFHATDPEVLVHTAAMADLRPCEEDPELARRVNVTATALLARLCLEHAVRMVFFSTDQVFNGLDGGYAEGCEPDPIHMYGRTKVDAEKAVLHTLGANATVVRVAIVFGHSPSGIRSCTDQVLRSLERGERPRLFTDEIRTPLSAEDVASATAELISTSQPLPLLHLGGPDRVSRYDIGCTAARAFGYDPASIDPVKHADLNLSPPRPPDLSLDTSLAREILETPPRPLDEGMARLVESKG